MSLLRRGLDRMRPQFEQGGRLQAFSSLFEILDTFFYTPGEVTKGAPHVRDALDLKRLMFTVVVALVPAMGFGIYNTGLQAHLAVAAGGLPLPGWRTALFTALGFAFDPGSVAACVVYGALWFVPLLVVTFAVGGGTEALFSIVRRHEINEGFFVTGFLYPLILPPTLPLWQAALGIAFAIVLGKEVFGGTGMNILNPALTGRAFLFFAYPAQISGETPWVAATLPDGTSGATLLARLAEGSVPASGSADWWSAFWGTVPGSIGETSLLCILLGAALLLVTKIGSWRTMAGVVVGTLLMSLFLNAVGSDSNPMFAIPFHWHVVLGGWAFGMVFMATDPVTSPFTEWGKLLYGFFIGVVVVLIRVVNPAYPEGMMLAILLMNIFAPLIDHFFVQANIRRRKARYAAT